MAGKPKDRDERIKIPLDPVEALKGLLRVDPESPPVDDEEDDAR